MLWTLPQTHAHIYLNASLFHLISFLIHLCLESSIRSHKPFTYKHTKLFWIKAMDLLFCLFTVLCVSLSIISAEGSNTSSNFTTTSTTSSAGHDPGLSESFTPEQASNSSLRISPGDPTAAPPTQSQSNSLTMLAFGVISFILVLIIVMVILVTVVNLRGRCHSAKEEGIKSYDSVVPESHMASAEEKESMTLVSIRKINTDTDSLRISSVHSTILDNENQELSRDLLITRAH